MLEFEMQLQKQEMMMNHFWMMRIFVLLPPGEMLAAEIDAAVA